jgi:DNA polymerase-3 subunit gamma/tau
MNSPDASSPDASSPQDDRYQVVALRYRPQSFESLVGQGHIATALSNAINQNRVGHAYLFTGARGVGKTSSARIFAKCLNCEKGPTIEPCNECDTCQAISVGEDVDVLEIDGASNRGIDEIRQLRSNVAVRPSRSRFKIYIIDEVHMLTQQAFNALLKTLEEPPSHVKFIFCTTDPQKIPITVLSRCQRFDFSPVQTDKISLRLKEIAEAENVTASDEALQLLARRANGSMRDSQSLLEQLFSFCGDEITIEEVHQLLGTTDIGRITEIATAMVAKDTNATLSLIHQNLSSGVNAGQLAGQLLGYFRDMMAVRVGCNEDTLLNCAGTDIPELTAQGETLGLETILSVVQVLDNTIVRMQASLHGRTLLEVAAVRICGLEQVDSIAGLIKTLSTAGNVTVASGGAGKTGAQKTATKKSPKKKLPDEVSEPSLAGATASAEMAPPAVDAAATVTAVAATAIAAGAAAASSIEVPSATALQPAAPITEPQTTQSQSAQSQTAGPVADLSPAPDAADANPDSHPEVKSEVNSEPDSGSSEGAGSEGDPVPLYRKALGQLTDMTADMASNFEQIKWVDGKMVVTLVDAYNTTMCSKPDRKAKIESAVGDIAGRAIRVDFVASKNKRVAKATAPKLSRVQQIRELQEHKFVKEAVDLFDCEITDFYRRN